MLSACTRGDQPDQTEGSSGIPGLILLGSPARIRLEAAQGMWSPALSPGCGSAALRRVHFGPVLTTLHLRVFKGLEFALGSAFSGVLLLCAVRQRSKQVKRMGLEHARSTPTCLARQPQASNLRRGVRRVNRMSPARAVATHCSKNVDLQKEFALAPLGQREQAFCLVLRRDDGRRREEQH